MSEESLAALRAWVDAHCRPGAVELKSLCRDLASLVTDALPARLEFDAAVIEETVTQVLVQNMKGLLAQMGVQF